MPAGARHWWLVLTTLLYLLHVWLKYTEQLFYMAARKCTITADALICGHDYCGRAGPQPQQRADARP